MKVRMMLLLLLAALLALPCAMAEDAALAPIADWLKGKQPAPAPYAPNKDCYLPDNTGYEDESISVHIDHTYWTTDVVQVDAPAKNTTTVMSIRVKLTDVTQLRTALAASYPRTGVTRVAEMAERNNAVLAINSDYFMHKNSNGIIYRNGRELRFKPNNKRDQLIIDQNGDFHFLRPGGQEAWDAYIAGGGTVLHTFFFGPCMLNEDGTAREDFEGVSGWNGPESKAQRIVLAQTGPLEYVILCNEGPESRDPKSEGFDLVQLGKLCEAFGLTNAYNLDGGSSCSVILNNEKINSPSNPKKRSVGDCIYFATLVPND